MSVVDDKFEKLLPETNAFELDISLGGGKRLMNQCKNKRPTIYFSPVVCPKEYWDASYKNLTKKGLLAPGDGHETNKTALRAMGEKFLETRHKIFDLGLLEDRPFYDIGLAEKARRIKEQGGIGELEIIRTLHGYVKKQTALRVNQFMNEYV